MGRIGKLMLDELGMAQPSALAVKVAAPSRAEAVMVLSSTDCITEYKRGCCCLDFRNLTL